MRAYHSWEWGAGFYSGFDLSYLNPQEKYTDATTYSVTSGTVFEVSGDILGWQSPGSRVFSFGAAVNALWNPSRLEEIGYTDIASSRYFMINTRAIDLMLPRAKLSFGLIMGPLKITIDGEYSPWFTVNLNQTLAVGTTGTPVESNHLSATTAANAFSVNGNIVLNSPVLIPEIQYGIDIVPLAYSFLGLDGAGTVATYAIDTITSNLSILGGFTLAGLKVNGVMVRVLAGYEWDTIVDRTSGAILLEDGKILIKIGLSM